jgi:predicted ester cyclase
MIAHGGSRAGRTGPPSPPGGETAQGGPAAGRPDAASDPRQAADHVVETANKALARRWFDEGWSQGRLEIADEIFAPDFTLRGRPVGPDGPRESVSSRRRAFADLTAYVDLQVAEGDLVVTHFTTHARHVAEFAGVPPTGRWVTASGIVIWRVSGGLVREDWNVFDRAAIDRQISAPAP